MNKLFNGCLALTFCWSAPLRARELVDATVEWLTCESQTVAVGKLVSVHSVKGPYEVVCEDCVLSVTEVLKGPPARNLNFCYRHLSEGRPDWMTSKGDLLVFLAVHQDRFTDQEAASLTDPYYEARLHGLLMPVDEQRRPPVFDLSHLPKDVYSQELTSLTKPEEILRIVRAWKDSTITRSLLIELPYDSPVSRTRGCSGGALLVPAEEKYRARFLALAGSQKPYERQKAAAELAKFPGPDAEQVLLGLLKDNAENVWFSSADTVSKVGFGVRAAAYHSLQALGKPVPTLELERQPTGAERRELRHSYWLKAFAEALTDGWQVVSVEDGDTRQADGRETTAVSVVCGKADASCTLRLIPKEWKNADLPAGKDLGTNGANSQGARRFFLDGELPPTVQEKLTRYFGLVRS